MIASGLSNMPGTFRDWQEAFGVIKQAGITLRAYTPSAVAADYEAVCELKTPIDVRLLILEMAHATAGLCGSPYPDENMKYAMPNKLFEYIAAGIPVICLGKQHYMAEFISDHGIGITVDEAREIPIAYQEIQKGNYRKQVLKVREKFVMEKEAERVRVIYEGLIA